MYAERHVVTLTTDSSGNAVGYTDVVTGAIKSIRYVKTDFADGVDFTITLEATGENVWTQSDVNSSATVHPQTDKNTTAGVPNVIGSDPVLTEIVAVRDRVKISIGSGGDTKTGTFHVVVG